MVMVLQRTVLMSIFHPYAVIDTLLAARKKKRLSKHKRNPLEFPKTNVNLNDLQSKKIMRSDETKLELFGGNDRRYVWKKLGEPHAVMNLVPTVKLWGCLAASAWYWRNVHGRNKYEVRIILKYFVESR